MHINTVTIERKKFSDAVQLISSVFNYIYVSYAQIMYSRWKMQTGGSSSKETG